LLIDDLGLTFMQVGIVAMVVTVAGSITQPIFGYLSDRWDSALIVAVSIAWLGVFLGLVGFAWSYTSLLIIVGLGVLGSAAFHPPGATFASMEGGKRRGTALSIFSVGGNLGSAFSPLLVAIGLSWLGLRGTGLLIPLAVLVGIMLYHPLKQAQESLASTRQAAQQRGQVMTHHGSLLALTLVTVAAMARSWVQVSLATYLPVWLQSQGMSLTSAGQILSVFLFSLSIGGLVGGWLSDRIGFWQVFALGMGLLLVGQWFFLHAVGFALIVSVSLMGAAIGSTFPVAILMAQDVWPQGVGLAAAVIMGFGWAPGGIGASVTGWIADNSSLAVGLQSLLPVPVVGLLCIFAYVFFLKQMNHKAASEAKNIVRSA
jgi:FSR family fosmidomycin resistance protein-like MFS transporter